MATLATVYSKLISKDTPRAAQSRAGVPVRAFAHEDIYFYVKRIDNSRLVRQTDPQAGGACWKVIGSVVGAAVLLIAVLLPRAYGLLAGYQIQSLKAEASRLESEQASLELREASLVSPARMEELARAQRFVYPEPQRVVYLDSKDGSSVAMTGLGNPKR